MPIKKISGLGRMVWLVLFMLAFMLVLQSFAWVAFFKHTYIITQPNTGVVDTFSGTWEVSGCSVEVMYVNGNNQYDPPGGDDVIVGAGKISALGGRFTVTGEVTTGWPVYIRVWNANNTKYGTSEITTVPIQQVVPQYGYDVGPGGLWTSGTTTSGANVPALYVNQTISTLLPTIVTVKPATVELGDIITIEGSNFGSGSGGLVTIEGITITKESCLSWSSNTIEVRVTADMTANSGVAVSVFADGQTSNTKTLDIDPYITTVVPSTELVSGVTSLTITGGGFGSGTVTVNYNGASGIGTGSVGGDTVTTTVPKGGTSGPVSGNLTVSLNSRTSDAYAYTMATPEIASIDPLEGNIGDTATIYGTKFGTVDAGSRSTSVNHVNLGDNKLTDGEIVSWETSFIKINVTSIATAGVYAVTVEAGGYISSDAVTYTITPEITKVSSSDGSFYIGHTNLTIEGTAFGGAKGLSTAMVGGITIEAPVTWSPTKITGILSSLEAAGTQEVMVSVESGGVYYPANIVQIICKPYITTLTPSFGTAEVTWVIINGYGFGTTGEVKFNGTAVNSYHNWANTSIEALVPSGAASGPVTVEVNGQKSNGKLFIVNDVPVIASLDPNSGSTKTRVTIGGSGFNGYLNGSTVTFNGVSASIESWTSTAITVEAPAGGITGPVVVNLNSIPVKTSNNNKIFIYVTPEVVSVMPGEGNVGDIATIEGTKFGTIEIAAQRSTGVNNVKLGGIQVATAEVTNWINNAITITIPTTIATAGVYAVTIEAADNITSDAITYTVTPEITKVSSSDGFFYIGHTNVTIEGTAFGGAKGLSSAIIGGLSIEAPVTWSPTKITGILSSLEAAGTQEVMVTVESGGVYYPTNIIKVVCKPYITTLTPSFGTPEATWVIINGYGFGTTGEVTFNGTSVTSYHNWANTSIEAKVPFGATTGPVTVEVNGQKSNGKPFTVSIVPVIATITPESGSTKTQVVISGINFGPSGTVSFESGVTAGNIQWSPTVITVEAPAGGKTGNVYVRQGTNVSNGVLFTYLTPEVVGIDPSTGNVGDTATINGSKFGTVDAVGNNRSSSVNNITLSGIQLATSEVISWESTFIKIKVLTSIATAGVYAVTIEAAGNITTDAITYTITPEITKVSSSDGFFYIGHTNLTIEGTAFGGAKGLSTAMVGGITIEAPVTWSPTKITGILSSLEAAGTQEVMVSVESGGVYYPTNIIKVVCKPYITTLTPSFGTAEVTSVIINGYGFGTTGEVTFNGIKVKTYSNWANTSIEAKVPGGALTGPVTVEVNGQKSNGKPFTVSMVPVISSLDPESGSTKTRVTIGGTGFQINQPLISSVTFNGVNASIESWSDTAITVEAPAGGTTGPVVVTISSNSSNNNKIFTYLTPEVVSITPGEGNVGDIATIEGTKFGTIEIAAQRSTGVNNVKLGGIQLATGEVTNWINNAVTITIPTTIATAGVYAVTIEAADNITSDAITYTVTPEITRVSSSDGSFYIGHTNVTIEGTAFGGAKGLSSAIIGGLSIEAPVTWSPTKITGILSSLEAAGTQEVMVSVESGGVYYPANIVQIICKPYITTLTPSFGTAEVTSVIINGYGFGTTGEVTFNGIKVKQYSNWANTSIEALVPFGATTGPVTVEVNGQKSNGKPFMVSIVPVIDTITPESGSTKTQVVITGINFGPSGTVSFESGITAGNIQWSPTVITVEAPAGGKTGKVYVYNNSGNGSNGGLFTYLTPEVVTIDPSTGNVGDTATINGSKFGTVDAVGNNRSSSVNNITLSGIQLATSEVISWESTFIKIKVLTSIATAGVYAVTVEAGGNSSSDAVTYTVTPEITKVSSSDGFFYIGHTNVTIEGTAFGGAKGLSSAIIGGLSIEAPVTWSPTKITGILSSLETAGTQEVMVTVESGGIYYPANIVQIVCKPYITTLTPSFGTPEATWVIINGYGFGTTGEVTFNGTAVTSYDSWANTSIEAKVPLGATTGPVTVEVNGQKSNGMPFMVSIVPVITSITPESGSTKTRVTIVGRDFGTGTGTVSFESVTAGNIQWSPTVITVEAPAGGKTGNVYVRQGADVSNGVLFIYLTPEVVSIDPPQGNISDEAIITGTKFGTVDAGSRSTGINNVTLGGIKLTDGEIVSWETTFIKIKVLTSIATAGVYAVTIEAADNITSDAITYTVTPEITRVSSSDGSFYIGHTNMTIEGTAFGGAKGLSSAIVGGLTIEAPVTWSPTKITGILPSTLTAGTQEVMVTVESGGVDYPANSVQIVCKPYITLLTTSEGPVGTLVTLEGFGFGTTGEVTFSGTKATWLNWISSNTVEVKVPSGGATGPVTVEAIVNGQKSNGVTFNVLTFPYIGGITPDIGSTKTRVTITGDNFGTKESGNYVSFEGAVVVDPAGYLGWTNNLITVEAPAGGITGNVKVFKTTFSNPGYFTYVTPEVTGIIPSSGYVSDEAMITGTKFGTVDAGSRSTWVNNVKLGGIQLADGDIVSWETSFIKIKVPTSIATAGVYAVTVEAGGNSSSDAVIYTVSPEITSTPATYYIGNNMTISGWSFGPTRGTSYVKLVNDGNTYILTPQASKWSATSITLSTPEGLPITLEAGASNTTIEVVVVNGGTFISNVSAAITCEPNAIKVTPYQGYPSQLVTIEGFGFDTTGIVTFGAKTAATGRWTNTSIEVFVPSLTANPITPYLITVEVNGQLSQPLQFWVTTTPVPLITSVIPGTVHLGDIITIEGVNFSDSPSDGDHVTVNGTEFYWDNLAIKYWSDTIIRLTVTASMTAGSSVEVRVTSWGYPSTPYNKLNIDPWITTLVPSTELVSGITNLIITGGGFGSGTVPIAYTGASGSGPVSNGGSTITTTVPKGGASGPVSGNLTVTVNSRTSETYAYTMATPEITGITPPEGNISDEATITGTKFGTVDAGSRSTAFNNVNLGGIQLTDAEIVSWETTLIKINVTSIATAGMYAVTVEAGGNISSDAITYTVTPEITLVTGSDGSFYIGHTNVTIEGTAFGAGIGLSTAMVGGVNITPLTWDSSKVTGMLPDTLTAGTQEVMVTVESGGISYPANIVQIVCRPYITLLTTTEGIAGDVVTLEGFGFGTTGEVTFNGTPATANWISSMTVEAVVPSGATNGPVTIKVNGQESNGRLFTITAADIIFCAPALYRGDTDTYVTVEGLHTNFTGTVVANINPASGITVGTVDATDANHATVFITTIETNAAVGTRDITLTWAGGIATGEGLFVIKAPTLESIVPNSGVTGEVMIATIEGKGTHFNPGTILTFSATGVTGEVLSVIGPTTATVRIYTSSDASGGTRNVIMTTDLGGPVGTEEVTGPGMFTVIGPSHDTEGPSIEAVSVNGRRFIPRYNDILVPTFTLTANVIDMPIVGGVGVDTIEVIIDEYSSVALHLSPEYLNYIMTVQVTIPEELRNITSHLITIKAKDKAGNETTYRGMGVLIKGEVQIIGSVYNFPNPFKPLSADPQSNTTVIQYTLSTDSPVIVVIYDISGHEVQRVVSPAGANGGRAGLNSVSWHGRNLFGEVVGNGMYICKIISRGRVIGTGKLVIMD